MLTKQEASERIAILLREASERLDAAAAIARESGVGFSWDGPSRGMGGYFSVRPGLASDWEPESDGWLASSQSC